MDQVAFAGPIFKLARKQGPSRALCALLALSMSDQERPVTHAIADSSAASDAYPNLIGLAMDSG